MPSLHTGSSCGYWKGGTQGACLPGLPLLHNDSVILSVLRGFIIANITQDSQFFLASLSPSCPLLPCPHPHTCLAFPPPTPLTLRQLSIPGGFRGMESILGPKTCLWSTFGRNIQGFVCSFLSLCFFCSLQDYNSCFRLHSL